MGERCIRQKVHTFKNMNSQQLIAQIFHKDDHIRDRLIKQADTETLLKIEQMLIREFEKRKAAATARQTESGASRVDSNNTNSTVPCAMPSRSNVPEPVISMKKVRELEQPINANIYQQPCGSWVVRWFKKNATSVQKSSLEAAKKYWYDNYQLSDDHIHIAQNSDDAIRFSTDGTNSQVVELPESKDDDLQNAGQMEEDNENDIAFNSEDDEEEIEAEEMEYGGKTYIVNPSDGTIYDADNDFAEIGKWDFDEGKPNLD